MEDRSGIRTENLTIGYSEDLIRDICLEVQPGKILTLIGPNGCGKSTLLRTLTGELKQRGGTVCLDGKDRSLLSAKESARRMSMVMTSRASFGLMTCREAVETGRYPYTGTLGSLAQKDRAMVREAMEWMDVTQIADAYLKSISDGQRQRVMLARAICQEPEVLILDEPTSYLDIRHKLDILQKIRLLCRQKQVAVVMSLHELDIAMGISDCVAAMGGGRVLRIGPPEEVFREDFIRKLYDIEQTDTGLLGSDPWFEDPCVPPSEERPQELPFSAVRRKSADKGGRAQGKRAKVLMIQGTMSNVGKSLITAGLCRIFAQDGYRAAPFKSQNMALNSGVTADGLEMGRAQIMQAECAGIEPLVCMNPILLKPTGDASSQVIVNGKPVGNLSAREYFTRRKEYLDVILRAFEELSARSDIIVVEGAGSPAEMNLREDDIVNMGLARLIDAPVLLVGDIDRGGVFAQLIGTMDLLDEDEKARVKGFIVNKFRGDESLSEEGIRILESRGKRKVVGVVPFLDVKLDEEDSLSGSFAADGAKDIDIAVIRLRHLSNYTDLNPFSQFEDVSVRYVETPSQMGSPDMIVIPGTKNTIEDLRWLKSCKLADAILREAAKETAVIGICGGYQMLGRLVSDPGEAECGGSEEGLGLLPVDTVMEEEKIRTVFRGRIVSATGILSALRGEAAEGYEIHMGRTKPFLPAEEFTSGKTGYCSGNVYGTYVHGLFDRKEILTALIRGIAKTEDGRRDRGRVMDYRLFRQTQYDRLADALRQHLDLPGLYRIMGVSQDDS